MDGEEVEVVVVGEAGEEVEGEEDFRPAQSDGLSLQDVKRHHCLLDLIDTVRPRASVSLTVRSITRVSLKRLHDLEAKP